MKQGFKPKSINDIKLGMKVLFEIWKSEVRGTVKFIGSASTIAHQLGVELDPGEGEY